ncbi:hypothetical protein NE865_09541 [Phthorimaea operculella]|nr:hypothetical protein NE865_09541 [Phthorimaea operculella]
MNSRQNQQNCISCNRKIDRGCLLNCSKCKDRFHYTCLNIDSAKFREHQDELKRTVLCPSCSESTRSDSNNSTRRNSPAFNPTKTTKVSDKTQQSGGGSPTPLDGPTKDTYVTENRLREILRQEMSQIIEQRVTEKLKSIKDELASYHEAFDFFNKQFEDLKKSVAEKDEKITSLQKDNQELHGTVRDLTQRLSSVEQYMREANVEVNGIPESRSENLANTLIKISETVGCSLTDSDIQHITRVAKLDKENGKPRAVVAKLRNVRQRDFLLAAVGKFNKNKKLDEKLNSQQIGLSGTATPIYVSEHLTPANKSLHAATRKKAKEMKYKFTWVRDGRIYVRKDETCSCLLIRNIDSLNLIT